MDLLQTIKVFAKAPKLVIDEYLFIEKVVNHKEPTYLLLDMGSVIISNDIIQPAQECMIADQ